jgi:hypothetical protein
MAIEVHHAHGRRLGIFWFCGDCRKQSRLVSISCPWSEIPTIADRRQLPLGHEEGWLHVQALSPQLSAFPFDTFRGVPRMAQRFRSMASLRRSKAAARRFHRRSPAEMESAESAACCPGRLTIPSCCEYWTTNATSRRLSASTDSSWNARNWWHLH